MAFRSDPPLGHENFQSIHKGSNSRNRPWALEPVESEHLENIMIDDLGVWSRRPGSSAIGGVFGQPGGLGQFRDPSDSQQYGWAVFDTGLYRTTGGGLWDPKGCGVSFVSNRLHIMVEGNWSATSEDQKALYVSQIVPSSGVTEASHLVAFKADTAIDWSQNSSYAPLAITYWQNRLWKANDQVDGNGSDLMWSELDDGLTYSPANALSIEPGVGGVITALVPARDQSPKLWVFKEEMIAILTTFWGSSSALIPSLGDELDLIKSSVQVLTVGIGCIAPRSVQWVPGFEGADVLFLARDGVRSLRRAESDVQAGAGLPVSFNIPDWIDRINFDYAHKAVAQVYDNAYHLAVPMDGALENTHVLRFELFTQGWTLHTLQARDMLLIPFAGDQRLYFQNNFPSFDSGATNAPIPDTNVSLHQVYRMYSGTWDPSTDPTSPTVVTYRHDTRAFLFGERRIEKSWDHLDLLLQSANGATHTMTVYYNVDLIGWTTMASSLIVTPPTGAAGVDFGNDALPWNVNSAGNKALQRRMNLKDVPTGTFIQFRFVGDDDTAIPSFFNVEVAAEPMQEIFDNTR
jgi:hypothetical protein